MALTSNTLPNVENQSYNFSPTDEDRLCWRCGEPDSRHQWYGGKTYCDSAWWADLSGNTVAIWDNLPDVCFDPTKTFEPNPPNMTDEELVWRMAFVQDTRDWML